MQQAEKCETVLKAAITTVVILVGVLAVVSVAAVMGTSDYHIERKNFETYCGMVEKGYWPDYKQAADECAKLKSGDGQ